MMSIQDIMDFITDNLDSRLLRHTFFTLNRLRHPKIEELVITSSVRMIRKSVSLPSDFGRTVPNDMPSLI